MASSPTGGRCVSGLHAYTEANIFRSGKVQQCWACRRSRQVEWRLRSGNVSDDLGDTWVCEECLGGGIVLGTADVPCPACPPSRAGSAWSRGWMRESAA